MPFTPVAAGQIDLLQNAVDGDVFIPSFSRRSFLNGATAGLLSNAPALTMVGNLLTVDAPVRNYDLNLFAGLGISVETTVVAGNFPVVANRDVQVKNVAATSHTYTYPTTRRFGQLLVIAVATAALTTITTPSGWTLVQSQAGTESRTSVFTRTVDGTEPASFSMAFGTASGAVIRTWMIDIGDGPVEAVAGINDSAAGTSLDLATISPTWAVTEATSTLYIAILGLADDLTVSGFPAGYTVTGQDVSASGTANIDCTLAFAERAALGSSENPGAFTYPASRSTGHVIAIKPKVTARLNWDGLAVRKAGSLVGTRRAVNVIDGAGISTTVTDNAGTGAVDVTIASTVVAGHLIRDDGANMTQRAAANFTSSASLSAVLTDDAGNNETEITFQLGAHTGDVTSAANSLALTIANNAVTNVKAADMAANTIKANATAALADPADFAVTSESVVGRTSGNITNIASATQTALIRAAGSLFFASAAADQVLRRSGSGDLGFGTLVTNNIGDDQVTFNKTQNIANNRILGRITAATGNIEELTPTQVTSMLDLFTVADRGLVPPSGGGTTNFLRADGTFAAPSVSLPILDDGVAAGTATSLDFTSTSTITASVSGSPLTVAQHSVNQGATFTWTGNHSFGGEFRLAGGFNDTALAADQVDLSLTGINRARWVTTGGAPPYFIDSIVVGTNNRMLLMVNADTVDGLGIRHEGVGTATAANRFTLSGNVEDAILPPRTMVTAYNSGGSDRWFVNGLIFPFFNTPDCVRGDKLTHDGTDWRRSPRLRKSRRVCEWWEDFEFVQHEEFELAATSSRELHFGNTHWGGRGTNGTVITQIANEQGHPGILRMGTEGGSGSFSTIHRGGTPESVRTWIRGDEILEFEAVCRLGLGATDVGCFIGFSEDPSQMVITGTGNSHICGFFFDTAGAFTDTTIHCITRESDGTATNTDSAVAPSGWQVFTIRQEVVGTVEFFIDDVLVATHTTQVPDSENLNCGLTVINRSASVRALDVDYVGFESHPLNRSTG